MVFCFWWDRSPTAPSGVLKSSPALLAKSSTVTRLSSMASCATQKMRKDKHGFLVWRNEGARGCWGSTSTTIKGSLCSLCNINILYRLFTYTKTRGKSGYGVLLFSKTLLQTSMASRPGTLAHSIDDIVRIQIISKNIIILLHGYNPM